MAGFAVEDYNALPVSITYNFTDKAEAEQKSKTMEIFPTGTSFPVTKSLSFKNKLGNMNLLLHYTEGCDLMKGLPLQLASYKIHEGKMKHADKGSKVEFIIKVENNIHQIAMLQSAELKEAWTETEQIPIKKKVPAKPKEEKKEEAKPAEGTEEAKAEGAGAEEAKADAKPAEPAAPAEETITEYETKERQRSTTTSVNVDTSSHAIPPATKVQLRDIEKKLYESD